MSINLDDADYLIDTSVLSGLLDENNRHHAKARAWLANIPRQSRKLISVVAMAELRFGRQLAMASGSISSLPKLDLVISQAEKFDLLQISAPTAKEYAGLKACLAVSATPRKIAERRKAKWGNPESWKNEFSGEKLHIQENDLWQSAQALKREIVFVTTDKGVGKIASASGGRLLHIVL